MTERMSLPTIDIIRQQMAHIANNPAQRVRKIDAPIPTTLRKVLETIDSITEELVCCKT